MYQSLELFQTATAMARHAGARQAIVSKNIANADTPGFVAQQTASFDAVYDEASTGTLRTTRTGHQQTDAPATSRMFASSTRSDLSPNGNSVSLEEEMLNAVGISREHNRALTIYRHTMTVLRTTLGRT